MKNMATNQKLILLMLLTVFLTCWIQGVSHGGGAAGGIIDTVGAVGGVVGTAIGAVGTAVGLTVGALADAVELTVGIVGLTVELTASIVLLPVYGAASDIAVFPNGVVGIVSSNYINLWAPDKLGLMTEFSYSSHLNSIAFHPGGGTFASGSEDSNIQLWNLQTERLDATLHGHTSNVLSVDFSPDGSLLASGGSDDTVRLWNPDTETLQATLRGHTSSVLNVAFSPDGSLLASGSADGTVRLWNPVTETLQETLEAHIDSVLNVDFSPDGSLLASASFDGLVGLWDPHMETLQATLGHESPVLSVDFSPDGNLLASGSTDGTARLWDLQSKKVVAMLGHGFPVKNVDFSPDGSALITGSGDGKVRQWTITISPNGIRDTSTPLRTLAGHERGVNSVAFSPDGQTLASGGHDRTVSLWNADTGALLRTLTGHGGTVLSVAFSPDGQMLASGSFDDTIRLWNADTGALLRVLTGHNDWVWSVAFSPDGQMLAGGSRDDTVRLWEIIPNTTVGSRDNTLVGVIPNTTVSLSPASVQSPTVGDRLTVDINITGGVKVAGYQATIQFDTTALRYVEGVNGDYLRGTVFFGTPVVDGNGVTLNATSLAGDTNGDSTLATLTFEVVSAEASTLTLSEVNLVDSAGEKTHPKVEGAQITEPALGPTLDADVNGDGSVDAQDLIIVTERLGQTGSNSADVNGDGIVDIADLTLVAGAIGDGAAAPSLYPQLLREFTVMDVKLWLSQAQRLDLADPRIRRGIFFLEQLLAALIPKETALLPNYPNPFNPETWIPYRLAADAFVTLTIYDSSGQVVRTLDVGHRVAAVYESRSKAIYWDGRNEFGEGVANGVYFYHLSAGDYSATRRMLILK